MSTIVLKKVGAQDYGNYIFTARSASVNASVIFAVHVYRKSSFLIEISKKWTKPRFDHVFFPTNREAQYFD